MEGIGYVFIAACFILLVIDKVFRFWKPSTKYDAFISYNSADRIQVFALANFLEEVCGLKLWLDKQKLKPGVVWSEQLKKGIIESRSCIFCWGPSGLSYGQDREIKMALNIANKRRYPIYPILLPKCQDIKSLPAGLERFQWIDLREDGFFAFLRTFSKNMKNYEALVNIIKQLNHD